MGGLGGSTEELGELSRGCLDKLLDGKGGVETPRQGDHQDSDPYTCEA